MTNGSRTTFCEETALRNIGQSKTIGEAAQQIVTLLHNSDGDRLLSLYQAYDNLPSLGLVNSSFKVLARDRTIAIQIKGVSVAGLPDDAVIGSTVKAWLDSVVEAVSDIQESHHRQVVSKEIVGVHRVRKLVQYHLVSVWAQQHLDDDRLTGLKSSVRLSERFPEVWDDIPDAPCASGMGGGVKEEEIKREDENMRSDDRNTQIPPASSPRPSPYPSLTPEHIFPHIPRSMSLTGAIEVVKCVQDPATAFRMLDRDPYTVMKGMIDWHQTLATTLDELTTRVQRHAMTLDPRFAWPQVELNQGRLPTSNDAYRVLTREDQGLVVGYLLVAQCIHQAILSGELDSTDKSKQLLDLSPQGSMHVTMNCITHGRQHHEILYSFENQVDTDVVPYCSRMAPSPPPQPGKVDKVSSESDTSSFDTSNSEQSLTRDEEISDAASVNSAMGITNQASAVNWHHGQVNERQITKSKYKEVMGLLSKSQASILSEFRHGKLNSLFGPKNTGVWSEERSDSLRHILSFSPADPAVWATNLQSIKSELSRVRDSSEAVLPVEAEKIVKHGQKVVNFLRKSLCPLTICAISMTKEDVHAVILANQSRANGATERDAHVSKQLNLLESVVEQIWSVASPMIDHITSLFKLEHSWFRSRVENSCRADFPVLKIKWVVGEYDKVNTMIEKAQQEHYWDLCEKSRLQSPDYGQPILYALIRRVVEPLQRSAAVNNAGHKQGFTHIIRKCIPEIVSDLSTRLHALKPQASAELSVSSIRKKGPHGSPIQARGYVLQAYLSVFQKCQTATEFTLSLVNDEQEDGPIVRMNNVDPFSWALMSLDKLERNSNFTQLRRMADFPTSEAELVKASKEKGKGKDGKKSVNGVKGGTPKSASKSGDDNGAEEAQRALVKAYREGSRDMPDTMAAKFNVLHKDFKCFHCGGQHLKADCTHLKEDQTEKGKAEVQRFRDAKREAGKNTSQKRMKSAVRNGWKEGLFAKHPKAKKKVKQLRKVASHASRASVSKVISSTPRVVSPPSVAVDVKDIPDVPTVMVEDITDVTDTGDISDTADGEKARVNAQEVVKLTPEVQAAFPDSKWVEQKARMDCGLDRLIAEAKARDAAGVPEAAPAPCKVTDTPSPYERGVDSDGHKVISHKTVSWGDPCEINVSWDDPVSAVNNFRMCSDRLPIGQLRKETSGLGMRMKATSPVTVMSHDKHRCNRKDSTSLTWVATVVSPSQGNEQIDSNDVLGLIAQPEYSDLPIPPPPDGSPPPTRQSGSEDSVPWVSSTTRSGGIRNQRPDLHLGDTTCISRGGDGETLNKRRRVEESALSASGSSYCSGGYYSSSSSSSSCSSTDVTGTTSASNTRAVVHSTRKDGQRSASGGYTNWHRGTVGNQRGRGRGDRRDRYRTGRGGPYRSVPGGVSGIPRSCDRSHSRSRGRSRSRSRGRSRSPPTSKPAVPSKLPTGMTVVLSTTNKKDYQSVKHRRNKTDDDTFVEMSRGLANAHRHGFPVTSTFAAIPETSDIADLLVQNAADAASETDDMITDSAKNQIYTLVSLGQAMSVVFQCTPVGELYPIVLQRTMIRDSKTTSTATDVLTVLNVTRAYRYEPQCEFFPPEVCEHAALLKCDGLVDKSLLRKSKTNWCVVFATLESRYTFLRQAVCSALARTVVPLTLEGVPTAHQAVLDSVSTQVRNNWLFTFGLGCSEKERCDAAQKVMSILVCLRGLFTDVADLIRASMLTRTKTGPNSQLEKMARYVGTRYVALRKTLSALTSVSAAHEPIVVAGETPLHVTFSDGLLAYEAVTMSGVIQDVRDSSENHKSEVVTQLTGLLRAVLTSEPEVETEAPDVREPFEAQARLFRTAVNGYCEKANELLRDLRATPGTQILTGLEDYLPVSGGHGSQKVRESDRFSVISDGPVRWLLRLPYVRLHQDPGAVNKERNLWVVPPLVQPRRLTCLP